MIRNEEITNIFNMCHKKRNVMRINSMFDILCVISYIICLKLCFSLDEAIDITQRNSMIAFIIFSVIAIGLLTHRIAKNDLYVTYANKQIVDAVEKYVLYLAYQQPNIKPKDIWVKAYQKNKALRVCFEIKYEDFDYTEYIKERINYKLSEVQREISNITNLEMMCS